MSELLDKILEQKAISRKRLADLSFEEKIAITEKLRDRSLLIASSQLRKQTDGAVRTTPTEPGEIEVQNDKRQN